MLERTASSLPPEEPGQFWGGACWLQYRPCEEAGGAIIDLINENPSVIAFVIFSELFKTASLVSLHALRQSLRNRFSSLMDSKSRSSGDSLFFILLLSPFFFKPDVFFFDELAALASGASSFSSLSAWLSRSCSSASPSASSSVVACAEKGAFFTLLGPTTP